MLQILTKALAFVRLTRLRLKSPSPKKNFTEMSAAVWSKDYGAC